MKANHLLTQILLSVTMVITAPAIGQIKTINVLAPPEIKLVPLPSRIVIFQDLDTNEPGVARHKKEELIGECLDSMLSVFARTVISLLPAVEFIVLPVTKIDDSLETPFLFLRRYNADLAFGIADFRPEVVQGEVTTTKNYDNSKSKTAGYSMTAGGVLRIYNSGSLLKTFTFSESQFLQERAVMSGLLAAGPSLVKNEKSALEVTDRAAKHLAEMFVSQQTTYSVFLFKKKELKEVTYMIEHDNYEEALQKALQLTTGENGAISSRANYLCALLYHIQTDFAKAFEHVEQARKTKKIVSIEGWNSYYYFLKKYVVDNEVVWKE
jgi:hypothetical protein